MGILKKYSQENWHTREHGPDFLAKLERGELGHGDLSYHSTYGSECPDCEEKVIAFKYLGQRYDLHFISGRYIIHQCPPYIVDECWPDDPNVRDSDGNIVEWSDESWAEPRDYSDDPYDPTEGAYPAPYGGYNK